MLKNFRSFVKSIFGLSLIIFGLNLLLKLSFITSIPPVLTNDETYYAAEAQAILANGTDMLGRWRPWHLAPANPIYSELTGLILAPGFWLFPTQTQLAAKIVPVMMGSLIPIFLGLIAYKLFQRKIFFLVTSLVATFNPWLFQFSRMSFDSLPGVFFYLLGMTILLYAKGWRILLAAVPFFLGFYQYQGFKPILVPLTILTLGYVILAQIWTDSKINWQRLLQLKFLPHVALLILSCILVASYLVRLPKLSSGTRLSEFAVDPGKFSREVETNRRLSFVYPLLSLFENKFVLTAQQYPKRLLQAIDPTWYFFHGNDNVDTFAVTQFGFLHFIDAFLICVGIWALGRKKSWSLASWFLLGWFLISLIPSMIKTDNIWITFRNSFTFLNLSLLVSIGLASYLLDKSIKQVTIVMGIYFIFTLPFFHNYFYRYPLLATKDIFFYNRVVANYIQRQPEQKFVIFSANPKTFFDSLMAYNQLFKKFSKSEISTAYSSETFELGNIKVAGNCFEPDWIATQAGTTVLVDYQVQPCTTPTATNSGQTAKISISSVIDSGAVYRLFNESYCASQSLPGYIRITKNVMSVEKLNQTEFCQSFFTSWK